MFRIFLTALFAILSLAQVHAMEQTSSPDELQQLHSCITKIFREKVTGIPDKELIFDQAFSACHANEESVIKTYQAESNNASETQKFAVYLRKAIKQDVLTEHFAELDGLLWQAGYVSTLAQCESANLEFLGKLRSDFMTQAFKADIGHWNTRIVAMEVEHHSINFQFKAEKIGIDNWCKAERTYLEKKGAKNFFLKQ